MRNDSAHQLQKFDTNPITNSMMADKMAARETLLLAVTQPFINMETSFYSISPHACFHAGLSCFYNGVDSV